MSTTTQTTEERLRSLLEAATPGPWDATALPIGDGPLPEPAHIYGPDGDSFIDVNWNPGRNNEVWTDAALIVEAVNTLPKLLAVVAAARDTFGDCYAENEGGLACGVHEDLRAALAALDEEGKR